MLHSERKKELPVDVEKAIASQLEVLQGLRGYVEKQLGILLPMDKAWQPTDYLPDLTAEDWQDQISVFRAGAQGLSDEVLVVLVGDMVTEEALPSYAVSLNLIARDYSGSSDDPWAKWSRGWTAEENRHGDLLNAYLRLTGRVDMRSVEYTVHHLIAEGFNPRAFPDLYAGLIYPAFQERATKISHANVAKLAAGEGDPALAKICQKIAGDESRHESFYTKLVGQVLQQDPERGLLTFFTMMKKVISMPGKLMYDGKDPDLFDHFAIVAQKLGVYTVQDYAEIVGHLVKTWGVEKLSVSGKAAKAQQYLCSHADRCGNLVAYAGEALAAQPKVSFSWIYDRLA